MKKYELGEELPFDSTKFPVFRPEDNMHIINTISDDEIEFHFMKKRIDKNISDLYRKHCGVRREFRFNLNTMRGFYELIPI